MKPKTKFQRRIYDLSKELPPISEKQKYWAYKKIASKYVVISRNRTFCLECGHKWEEKPLLAVKLDGCNCPACNEKLKFTENTHVECEKTYFAILTTKAGFQVVRMFLFTQRFKKKKATSYDFYEVMQHWIDEKGRMETLARPANGLSGYAIDLWSYGDLEPRTETYTHKLRQEINPYKVYTRRSILPVIKRNGFRGHLYGFSPQWLFAEILTNNRAETLYKTKQIEVLAKINVRARDVGFYWKSICICTRNNYIIKDATIWYDYLGLLSYFGKDISNPKYICPANLKQEHDRFLNKRNKIFEDRKKREEEQEFIKYQSKYKREKGHLFGVKFQDGELYVKPMTSIDDFKKEAEKLKHCVYSNKYFTKEDSLIMSAQIKGEPVETVEVNLKEFKVVQSRGKFNQASEHHDRILSLVQSNMEQIANVMAV